MDKIKVAIVDDDPDWIKAMTSFLNGCKDFLVVGTANGRSDAFKLATSIECDVILLDINLHGTMLDGINTAIDILNVVDKRIIMLTSYSEDDIVTKSFAAGAVNFIQKADYAKLPDALLSSMKSNIPLNALLREFRRLKKEENLQVLTNSEKDILRLAEQGFKRTEISARLFKSENTIKKQIKTILSKLNSSNIKEAVRKVNHMSIFDENNKDRF